MKRGKRRWWLVALIAVVVAAAAITAALLLRDNKATVHYLTSTATKGTIAQIVQADFTLANAHDPMTISLGGTSPSASTAAATSHVDSGITLVSLVTRGVRGPTPMVMDRAILADTTPAPSLTGFTPSSGPVGTTVTLTGAALSGATAVAFNGTAAFFETVGDTQVTAIVPSGATTGPITITTPGGAATSADSFTVTARPTPKPTPSRTRTPSPKPAVPYSGNSRASTSSYTGNGGSSGTSAATAAGVGSSASNAASGIVTRLALPVGATPHTLQRLLTVSGTPVFAFVSSAPLYATLSVNLSSGAQATSVAALQRALKARGYYTGSINGDFGTTTETALKSWQSANDLSQTGEITTSQFVWVPKGAVLESWNVAVGSHVTGTTPLATVGHPHDLIAQALVSQADVSSLRVGEKAALTIDGATGDPFTATITSIADQPASSSSGGGSSSAVEYAVDLAPHGLPSLAKAGMTGSLTITIASRSNVLLVPTSAVSGTSSVSFVRVMMNGTPAFRQVTTGMATSSLTQITSGLTAGEVVVTGQYSNNATTNASGTGGLGIPGLGGGNGGFFRRNSSGSFGGSSNGGPAGGGQ